MSEFLQKLGPEMAFRTYQHVQLVFIALGIALLIALPGGVILARTRWKALASTALATSGVVQTVPSLALIAFVVVFFKALGLPTVGRVPAVVALVAYALLPILRNTFTGLRQVDPAVVEVAQGMGMRPSQVLFGVELPLSLPVIMAGVRISTVWTIGVATLCGLIGAGGLGDPIFRGLHNLQMDYLLAGTIPAAALALTADWTLGALERWLLPDGLSQAETGG